jgi:hypothetical protein
LEWDLPVLDHDFKEDEQWGAVPELDSSFDECGDYKHHVIVQHLAYFQRQDGDHIDDVIDQCVLDTQTSQGPMSQSFMMHMRRNLLSRKVSHLHPPLLDQS